MGAGPQADDQSELFQVGHQLRGHRHRLQRQVLANVGAQRGGLGRVEQRTVGAHQVVQPQVRFGTPAPGHADDGPLVVREVELEAAERSGHPIENPDQRRSTEMVPMRGYMPAWRSGFSGKRMAHRRTLAASGSHRHTGAARRYRAIGHYPMAIAVARGRRPRAHPWSMTGPPSSKADEIRAYTLEHHVRPWRRSDEKRLAIRVGDVIRGMRLRNATPNVCSALASRKFLHEAAIVLVRRDGPPQSTTTTFHYASGLATPSRPPHREKNSTLRSSYQLPRNDHLASDRDGEWRTADLCLVSCVSVKRRVPSRAGDLYASPWFRKARACVEAMGCPWYILSAKHGLLDPNSTIDPYNQTLKTMPVNRRRAWASGVIKHLAPRLVGVNSVAFLAGRAYREFLERELRGRGLTIYVPMEGMGIGRQLSWLADQTPS